MMRSKRHGDGEASSDGEAIRISSTSAFVRASTSWDWLLRSAASTRFMISWRLPGKIRSFTSARRIAPSGLTANRSRADAVPRAESGGRSLGRPWDRRGHVSAKKTGRAVEAEGHGREALPTSWMAPRQDVAERETAPRVARPSHGSQGAGHKADSRVPIACSNCELLVIRTRSAIEGAAQSRR
jgi:hypothetical protein